MSKQATISRFFKSAKREQNTEVSASKDEDPMAGTSQDNSILLDDSSDDDRLDASAYQQPIKNTEVSDIEDIIETNSIEVGSDHVIKIPEGLDTCETGTVLGDTMSNDPSKWKYLRSNKSDEITSVTQDLEKSNIFDRKLGSIMKKRAPGIKGSLIEDSDEEQSDEDDSKKITKRRKISGPMKLTPLDQQIKDLKLKNMDKILVVRVGYKYKCFAQDAVIASKILHIKLIPGKLTFEESHGQDSHFKKFAYCSFPDVRLDVNLQRLLFHNLIVSVVEQSETAAIKKNTSNKNNVFERKISNTFSKATYGVNHSTTHNDKNREILGSSKSIWALTIEKVNDVIMKYFMYSINLNSGEIVIDQFTENKNSIDKLSTRCDYLQPTECVIISDVEPSPAVTSLLKNIECLITYQTKESAFTNRDIDEEELQQLKVTMKEVIERLNITKDYIPHSYPLYKYLKSYSNENSLLIASNYHLFLSKVHMILDHNALESLNIFCNDGKKGSLFWILDHTRTAFGSRQLLNWILKPLVKEEDIKLRLDATDCMLQVIGEQFFDHLNTILTKTPDLINTLNRISYGSTSRKEVYFFLKQMVVIGNHIQMHKSYINENIISENSKIHQLSSLITNIFSDISDYISNDSIPKLLSMINIDAALDRDKNKQTTEFFNLNNYDHPDDILRIQRNIEGIKNELKDELKKIKKILSRPYLEYKNESEYLIEIRNTQIKKIPDDWVKVNNTKVVSRFTTPETVKLVQKLNYQKELLLEECNKEYKNFLKKINSEYVGIKKVIQNLADYDCIVSLAATSCNSGYCRPIITSSDEFEVQYVDIRGGRNPVIESLDITYVPNDVTMAQNDGRINIITGPNMGGKSSYIRQVALLIVMAQIGSYVPAISMKFSLFDNILTRIGAQDSILEGKSTFKMEMEDVLRCIAHSSSKSLLLLDEVGRGTGTIDGKAISYALLEYFSQLSENCPLILFTTHFPELGATIHSSLVKNYYMDFVEEYKKGESWPSVVFLYTLKPGISNDSYGLNVARLANIESNIISKAHTKSSELKKFEETFLKPLNLIRVIRDANRSCKTNTDNEESSFKDRFLNLLETDDL
ncbi:Mismatch repair protein msh3 [Maudiozyma exigua]|uniref:DNA mismatch repair protein MSH3 n=1 Tax=Maudiozyma exigua TaxID=34358 RepID=A0A9P6WDA3_MAUEX|nr:Mismatch repair protein msh3 [Kazachstania exigua]